MRTESAQTGPSATYRLADHLLHGQLEAYVRERREAGKSWRRIALNLRDEVGVDVAHETLRNWFGADSAGAA